MALFHKIQSCGDLRCVHAIHGNYCLAENSLWMKDAGVWRLKQDLPFVKQRVYGFSRPDPGESLRFSAFHPDPSLQSKLSITTICDGETSTRVLDFQPWAIVALPSNFRGIRWVLLDSESLKMLDLDGKLVESHDLPAEFLQRLSDPQRRFENASLHWVCDPTTIDIFLYPKVWAKDTWKSELPYVETYWKHVFNLQITQQDTQVSWVPLGRDCSFPQCSPSVNVYFVEAKKTVAHRWNSTTRTFERLEQSFSAKDFDSINSVAISSRGYLHLCDQKLWMESIPSEIYFIPDQANDRLIYGFDSSHRIHRVQLRTSQTAAERSAEGLAKVVFDQLKAQLESADRIEAFFVEFAHLIGNPNIKRRKLE